MYEPSPSGFDSPGLADLFKVQYHGPPAPSAPTPSPRPLESRPNHRTAIIIGSLVGGIAGLTLVLELGWCYRRQIQRHITGGEYPRPEMDNHERVMLEMDAQKRNIQEMDDQQNFVQEMLGTESKTHWELPADNKPVEMWSPTDRSDRRSRSGGGQSCQGAPPADEKKGPESPTSGGLILEGSPKSKGSQRYDDKMLPPLPIC